MQPLPPLPSPPPTARSDGEMGDTQGEVAVASQPGALEDLDGVHPVALAAGGSALLTRHSIGLAAGDAPQAQVEVGPRDTAETVSLPTPIVLAAVLASATVLACILRSWSGRWGPLEGAGLYEDRLAEREQLNRLDG